MGSNVIIISLVLLVTKARIQLTISSGLHEALDIPELTNTDALQVHDGAGCFDKFT